MRHVTRRKLIQAGSAATISVLAGCTGDSSGSNSSGSNSSGSESKGTASKVTLEFGQAKSPVHFDPIQLIGVPSHMVMNRIFNKIYMYDKGTDLVPDLATDSPEISREGKRYVVEITDKAQFHNGDPVTAEDVVYSVMAPVREETGEASNYQMVSKASVIDETTAQFDLEYSYAPFPYSLATEVVPKAVRKADPEKFRTKQPIGSGPFKFDNWKEGEFVELSRWDSYWGKKPNVSGIKYTPIKEPTTRVTAFKNNKADIIQTIPPKLYSTVESINNSEIVEKPSIGYQYVAFNCNEGPTSDRRVREAVDYCINMDNAVERFIAPTGVRQYSPLPKPVAKSWDMPINKWKQIPHSKDISEAKSLFEKADVPDDWDPVILVPPDQKRKQIGVSIANGIKEAGYEASVTQLDWGKYIDTFDTGKKEDYQMYILGFSSDPHPDTFAYDLFYTGQIGADNGTYYDNKNVMDKIVKARQSNDHKERKKLYNDIFTKVLEDRVHLAGYNLKNTFGVNSVVSDFTPHPVSSVNPRMVSSYNNISIGR